MTTENNGNTEFIKPNSSSNEDLSEYTDADGSISAPTEVLGEFLSAVMLKDYVTALKYCKLILHYEPNNATAKDFYPVILQRVQKQILAPANNEEQNSSNDSEEEPEGAGDGTSSDESSESSCSSGNSTDSSDEQEEEDESIEVAGKANDDKRSKGSSDGDATTGSSYSSLEDDEAETVQQFAALTAKYEIDNLDLGNGNSIYDTITTTSKMEVGKTVVATQQTSTKDSQLVPRFGTISDSESPSEPVSQQTVHKMAAMLRARVVLPYNAGGKK